jgi:hypothetical protein
VGLLFDVLADITETGVGVDERREPRRVRDTATGFTR